MKKAFVAAWMVLCLSGASFSQVHAQNSTVVYTVKTGDSIWKIAQLYHTDMEEIIDQNRIQHPELIYSGQKFYISQVEPQVKRAEKKIIELTNQARTANGLAPLSFNWELTRMARAKSQDMRDRSYVAHQSPTYGSPLEMMRTFQIPFRSAEENIAAGQTTAEEVVKSWLSSPENRRKILNPSLNEIGCGVAFGGDMKVYWTQEFILK